MATDTHDKSSSEQGKPTVDVMERAGHHTGNPQQMDRRLFMQLSVYHCGQGIQPSAVVEAVTEGMRVQGCPVVIYADVNDPHGRLEELAQTLLADDLESTVGDLITSGKAKCKVLSTTSSWFGVTYREDRPHVVDSIRALIQSGEYPEKLWT